jgi:predicted HTH transcriptional regulator
MTRAIPVSYLANVVDYVTKHGSITNKQCRDLCNVNYDESIKILNALCMIGALKKIGVSSTTKYILSGRPGIDIEPQSKFEGTHRKY